MHSSFSRKKQDPRDLAVHCLWDKEDGGTFDCRAGHVGRHAIDDKRGSDDKIRQPASASKREETSKDNVVVLTAHSCSWRMDVSIDTTHFRLTSRRHGWNMSQSASDMKG